MVKGKQVTMALLVSAVALAYGYMAWVLVAETLILGINIAIILFVLSGLIGVERGLSKRMIAPFSFFLFIASAEMVFTYINPNRGALIHLGVITAALFSSTYLRQEDAKIIHAFILVSLLRIVNVALPLQGISIFYQYLLIYSLLLVSAVFYMYSHGLRLSDVGIKKTHLLWVVVGVVLGVVYGYSEYIVIGVAPVFPRFIIASFFVFLLLGIVEELIFRGVLQSSLAGINPLFAILLSSLVFATMHSIWIEPFEYVFTFYVGVVLAFVYHKTGSLAMPVATHIVINIVLFQVIPFKPGFFPGL